MTQLQKTLQEMVDCAVKNGQKVDFRWALAEFSKHGKHVEQPTQSG